jgi:hypothetical protein
MLARVGTVPSFVVARDAIVTTLKEGPMSVPELAKKTGKSEVTITNTLQSYLLPNNEVMRTKRGIYALPGTEPSYISKSEAIVAALKKRANEYLRSVPNYVYGTRCYLPVHSSTARKPQSYSHQTRRLCLAWRGAGLRYNRRRDYQSFEKEADEAPCIGATYQ